MKEDTVNQLNQINIDFYNSISDQFSDSRSFYWDGWNVLEDELGEEFWAESNLRVLDAGCGNGRFGSFLADKGMKFYFEGWDVSQSLLLDANERLKEFSEGSVLLREVDLLDFKVDRKTEKFHLITLFGVLHHIPGFENRVELFKKLSQLLDRDGVIVVTIWDFMNDPRISKKVISWDKVDVEETNLEEGDYLLDWKRGKLAYRYCHDTSEEEFKRIVKASGLNIRSQFLADGKSGVLNRYYILGVV